VSLEAGEWKGHPSGFYSNIRVKRGCLIIKRETNRPRTLAKLRMRLPVHPTQIWPYPPRLQDFRAFPSRRPPTSLSQALEKPLNGQGMSWTSAINPRRPSRPCRTAACCGGGADVSLCRIPWTICASCHSFSPSARARWKLRHSRFKGFKPLKVHDNALYEEP
jgi:hypothetical protein